MIVINFKNYVVGEESIRLAKIIQRYLPQAIIASPAVDLSSLVRETHLSVYAQHVDSADAGRATGFVVPELVKSLGVKGTLLNHSEHPLDYSTLRKTIERAKKAGLKIIVCSPSVKETLKLKELKPHAIAYEDVKLVASSKSITVYRANEVSQFAKVLQGSGIIPLCGAGIHTKQDVVVAHQLGCKGVLIASAIAASKEPEKLLKDIKDVSL